MSPRFNIGEQVILQSVRHPELNGGPYTISEQNYMINGRDVNTGEIGPPGYRYQLKEIKTPGGPYQIGQIVWWQESALRKYYPPADKSFSELMEWAKNQPCVVK